MESETKIIHVKARRWHVRLWRWLTFRAFTYDGTEENPHPTTRRAMKDVPTIIGPGEQYVVDLTGVNEVIRRRRDDEA